MDTSEWVNLVLGGAGVSLIAAIAAAIRDYRKGRVMRDDTAIARWRELRAEKAAEAEKAWRLLAWYRAHYAPLWAAYMSQCGTAEDRERFPPSPPPDIDN